MGRFVDGEDRRQSWLLPETLDDYVADDNPVRVVEAFIGELDLAALGFAGMMPASTGRPAYHPSTLLKIYLYGYLNRVQSSRRREREAQRNVELMWLTGRLAPDFKAIANFRRDNGHALRAVCRQFVMLCRSLHMFGQATVAVGGSKFKAVNNGLRLRRGPRPLYLPGRRAPDQGADTLRPSRRHRPVSQSYRLPRLRTPASLYAREGKAREAMGA